MQNILDVRAKLFMDDKNFRALEAKVNAAKSVFRPSVSEIVQDSMTGKGAFKADQTKEN